MTWTGRPSTAAKVVRSDSWRRRISAKLRRRASTSSGPLIRTAPLTLKVGSPGASWSRNQSACCENDAGGGSSRPIARRAGAPRVAPDRRSDADPFGEVGDRRRLEEGAERHVEAEGVAEAGDDPRRQQRVAAELEEVVDGRRRGRGRGPRPRCRRSPPRRPSGGRRTRRRGVGLGGRQGAAVDLAVRRSAASASSRTIADGSRARGSSPCRWRCSSAVVGRRSGLGVGDDVGDEGRGAGPVLAGDDDGVADGRVPTEGASISPGSIRWPRIFTWSSTRPRYSSVPSGRQRQRSPVR